MWFVLAALHSIFPQAELVTFLTLSKKDKERQLKELTMIVTGIRLFNRECGKGGEGIDDCKYIISLTQKVTRVQRFNMKSKEMNAQHATGII